MQLLVPWLKKLHFDNPWDDNNSKATEPPKSKENNYKPANNNKNNQIDKGTKLVIGGVVLLPLLAWLSTGFYIVQPDQQGVLIRFGKYHSTAEPGLRYKFPDPIDRVEKVSVTAINRELIGTRAQSSTSNALKNDDGSKLSIPDESQMLTGDENIIDMHFFVQWKIKDAYNYVFKIRDTGTSDNITLKLSAESAMREVMGIVKLNDAISDQRQNIERQAKGILQHMLDEYQTGIEVVNLGILYSYVPSEVRDAYRDIQAAKADKEKEINQAYAYRNDIIPKARGTVFSILEEAKGKKEEIIAGAKGQADKFSKIYVEYKISPEVTRKRLYIETMESVLTGKEKILMTKGASNATLPLLPLQNAFNKKIDNDKQ